MSEATLQRKIRALLESRGARVYKQHGDIYSPPGIPDLLICYRGRFVAIEVKMPGKKPTEMQTRVMEEICAAGGIAFVADKLSQIEEFILAFEDSVRWQERAIK